MLIELPDINTVDIRKAHLKKQMQYHFSPNLIESISESLDLGKQVILFQNRRGYSPVISCVYCSYTPNCKSCDVSLTYYKWNNSLKCHYCGYSEEIPNECPTCKCKEFSNEGFGTEQIEESLGQLFPDYVTKRLDYDTTRRKHVSKKLFLILSREE